MSATSYCVAGAKGGVGKTTSSLNLAALFADDDDTIVVEFDLAMANAVDFVTIDCSPEEDPTLHEVLAGEATIQEAIYEAPGGFDILPSGTTLEGYVASDPEAIEPVVAALERSYDVVVLDVGAGLSRETLLPLGLADWAVLVSSPRVASVRDVQKTGELVERVGGAVAGVVFSKAGTGRAPEPERIAAFLEMDLLGHVPDDRAVPESQDAGRPVVVHAPNSPAAAAYRDIVSTLRGDPDEQGDGQAEADEPRASHGRPRAN